jgi:hypothetical protein
MFIQSSGVAPNAAARRSAMLAEILALLFNTRLKPGTDGTFPIFL